MIPSEVVLYRKNGACSMIPHAILHESGLSFSTVLLDFAPVDPQHRSATNPPSTPLQAADGSFSSEDYKKISPGGFVPALKVDGEVIIELPAVVTYICDLVPERHFLGTTPLERVRVLEWMSWLSTNLHAQGYGMLWRPQRFGDTLDQASKDSIRAKGKKTVLELYQRIEGSLRGLHAVGEKFTAADISLYVFWRWGMRVGIDMVGLYPKYTAIAKNVENMETVRKAISLEQQLLYFSNHASL